MAFIQHYDDLGVVIQCSPTCPHDKNYTIHLIWEFLTLDGLPRMKESTPLPFQCAHCNELVLDEETYRTLVALYEEAGIKGVLGFYQDPKLRTLAG